MGETSVRDRLIDATVDVAALHGLAKLSVGDVARRAGLSRQTLYKHFPSKESLLAEAVLREASVIVAAVIEASEPHDNPAAALEAGIATALRLMSDHALLNRLIRTEPEALLPLMLDHDRPVSSSIRGVVEHLVHQKVPDLSPEELRRCADLISRLLISYAVSPPSDSPEVIAEFAARVITRGVLDTAPLS